MSGTCRFCEDFVVAKAIDLPHPRLYRSRLKTDVVGAGHFSVAEPGLVCTGESLVRTARIIHVAVCRCYRCEGGGLIITHRSRY